MHPLAKEIALLYWQGLNYTEIRRRLHVADTTITQALRETKTPSRPRGGARPRTYDKKQIPWRNLIDRICQWIREPRNLERGSYQLRAEPAIILTPVSTEWKSGDSKFIIRLADLTSQEIQELRLLLRTSNEADALQVFDHFVAAGPNLDSGRDSSDVITPSSQERVIG